MPGPGKKAPPRAAVQTHRERPHDLTLWEWLSTLSQAARIGPPRKASSLLGKAAKGLVVRPRRSTSSFHEYIAYRAMRDYQGGLSPLRIQNLLPSTGTWCRRFARRHGLAHDVVELDYGAVAHRVGESKGASHVVVLFHGGGYMAPALSTHLEFGFGFGEGPPRGDVVVYVLQYGLVSDRENPYPRQLRQATALLHHLLHAENIPPPSITLLGDSAGAHLLLGLALHIRHPNPLVEALPPFKGRLAGAVLVSPWLSLHANVPPRPPPPQQRGEQPKAGGHAPRDDVLDEKSLACWARGFLGGAPPDPWNDPLAAPAEWWADLPVEDVLLLYGEDELLREDSVRLAGVLKLWHASTVAVGVPGEVHVHMMMNRLLFLNRPCASEEVYRRWMGAHLGGST